MEDWVEHHNSDNPYECCTVYHLVDVMNKIRDHLLPFKCYFKRGNISLYRSYNNKHFHII